MMSARQEPIGASDEAGSASDAGSVEDPGQRPGRSIVLFAVLTALALIQRLDSLTAGPIWDSAMTIWPAAIELSNTGFDFTQVLSMGSYAEGGPATHSTSLMTLVLAGLLSIASAPATIVITHLAMTLALSGTALMIWKIVKAATGSEGAALASAGAVVTSPLLVAQSTALYTDLPAAAAMYLALALWERRARDWAAAALLVGVLIKPTALLIVPVLLFTSRKGVDRLRALAPTVGAIPSLFARGGGTTDATAGERVTSLLESSAAYLQFIPDVVFFIVVAHVALLFTAVVKDDAVSRRYAPLALVGLTFIAFFAATGLLGPGQHILPRYYVFLVPAAAVMAAVSLSSFTPRLAIGVLGFAIVFNVVGRSGSQYEPLPHPIYAVAERSSELAEARHLFERTSDRLVALSKPIVATHHLGYTLSYPELGYVEARVPIAANLTPAGNRMTDGQLLGRPMRLDDLPECFVAASEFRGFEGELNFLLSQAEQAGFVIQKQVLADTSMETTIWIVDATPDDGAC